MSAKDSFGAQAILEVARPIGQLVAALFIVRWMLATLGGRLHPLGALGVSMATVVLFFPFVQAWYLLWAVIPLAARLGSSRTTGPRPRTLANMPPRNAIPFVR